MAAAATVLTWLAVLVVGCASPGSHGPGHPGTPLTTTPGHRYPALFVQGSNVPHGIGFSAVSPCSRDEASARAVTMACRSLSWDLQVRVEGERLVERMPTGYLVFCGESIRLLDVPEITPQTCVLDTQWVGEQVWIVAAPTPGPTPALGAPIQSSPTTPDWIEHPPQEPGFLYAIGVAPATYVDESGSWELAEYRALLDLGFAVNSTVTSLGKALDRSLVGVETIKVDTLLRGFRVVARWRDATHVHVLARVVVEPNSGR